MIPPVMADKPVATEAEIAQPDFERGHGTPKAAKSVSDARRRWTLDYSPENWMARVKDDVPVSALSVPGTHDSAAFTHPWPFLATQKMSILRQLNAGVRYFDLRCGLRNDIAEMVHGPSLLGLKFSDVLGTFYDWLDAHPTEGLIVQIKEDREPERSTMQFSQAIFSYVVLRPNSWRTENTSPLLGELRGKIQLFRRFAGPHLVAAGIDVTQWPDNPSTPFTIKTSHRVQLTIQDHYSFPDPVPLPSLIAAKGGDVSGLLDRASADKDENHWYLNFTSGYELNLWYQVTPRQLAVGGYYGFSWEDGVNLRLENYLRSRTGRQRFGIVAMDFPELGAEDLITALIQTNFKRRTSTGRAWLVAVVGLLVMIWLTYNNSHGQAIGCLLVKAANTRPSPIEIGGG